MCLDMSPVSPETKMSLAAFHAPILAFSKETIKGEKPRACPKAGPRLLSRIWGGQWQGEGSRTVPCQQVSPRPRHYPCTAGLCPGAGHCPKMRQSLNPLWCPWPRFCFPSSTNKQPQLRPSCLARSVRSLDQPRQLLLGLSRQRNQRRDRALRRKYFGKREACPFGYRQALKTNRTTAEPTGPLGRMNKYTPPS